MGVGKLFRPQAGVELGAEVGEPLAGVEDKVNLRITGKVGHWVECPRGYVRCKAGIILVQWAVVKNRFGIEPILSRAQANNLLRFQNRGRLSLSIFGHWLQKILAS